MSRESQTISDDEFVVKYTGYPRSAFNQVVAPLQEENKQLTEALEISEKDLTTVIAERDEFLEENKRLREGLTEWQYRLSLDPKSTSTYARITALLSSTTKEEEK